jgi:hypothetical protein
MSAIPMATRATGWIKDSPDDARSLLDAGSYALPMDRARFPEEARLPEELDLSALGSGIGDQGQTSSCTGWAMKGAMEIAARSAGLGGLDISARFLYANGRLKRDAGKRSLRGEERPVLEDGGATLFWVAEMVTSLGWATEADVPSSSAGLVNRIPSWDAYVAARARKQQPEAILRVRAEGAQRLRQVDRALANGCPVVFGTAVSQAFMDCAPSEEPSVFGVPMPDRVEGRHAMVVVGRRVDPVWGPIYLLRNSWGPTWGGNTPSPGTEPAPMGHAWVVASWLTAPETDDLTVVAFRPVTEAGPPVKLAA